MVRSTRPPSAVAAGGSGRPRAERAAVGNIQREPHGKRGGFCKVRLRHRFDRRPESIQKRAQLGPRGDGPVSARPDLDSRTASRDQRYEINLGRPFFEYPAKFQKRVVLGVPGADEDCCHVARAAGHSIPKSKGCLRATLPFPPFLIPRWKGLAPPPRCPFHPQGPRPVSRTPQEKVHRACLQKEKGTARVGKPCPIFRHSMD